MSKILEYLQEEYRGRSGMYFVRETENIMRKFGVSHEIAWEAVKTYMLIEAAKADED